MFAPNQIEEIYQEYTKDLANCLPDGIISIDLELLHNLGILEKLQEENEDDFTQYFHVIETPEKVTLFNEQFIVWIVPKTEQEIPLTYVLIAFKNPSKTSLEVVFTTSGVYNTPKYVLKVLQFYLLDMLETEATLTAIEKNQ